MPSEVVNKNDRITPPPIDCSVLSEVFRNKTTLTIIIIMIIII